VARGETGDRVAQRPAGRPGSACDPRPTRL